MTEESPPPSSSAAPSPAPGGSSPAKSHRTAVIVMPPVEIWDPIQAIRERHDKHIRRWMPHVNVLYPFAPHRELETRTEELERACAEIEPFEIALTGFRHFHHGRGKYTIWLLPEPDGPLQELAKHLTDRFPGFEDQFRHENGFTPHLSVGQFRGFEAVRRFKEKHASRWKPLRFMVEALYVIEREDPPEDVFRLFATAWLGPDSDLETGPEFAETDT